MKQWWDELTKKDYTINRIIFGQYEYLNDLEIDQRKTTIKICWCILHLSRLWFKTIIILNTSAQPSLSILCNLSFYLLKSHSFTRLGARYVFALRATQHRNSSAWVALRAKTYLARRTHFWSPYNWARDYWTLIIDKTDKWPQF